MNNTDRTTVFLKMVLDAWHTQNKRVDDLLNTFSEEQWMKETAPGRNTGIYLLGHLTAINDSLFAILDIGERLHPELDAIFVDAPDKSGQQMPSIETLNEYWKEINAKLTDRFNNMQTDEWFTKHTRVSAEDFAKEPHRNKLNIIINRTSHQAYHLGQINYLKA
jgi:hypothetical protein